MREQIVNLSKKLRIFPVLLTFALVTSMSGAALAAPPFQEGGDQTGGVEQDADQNDNQDQPEDAQDSNQPQSQFQQGNQQQNQQGVQQGQFQQGNQQQGQFQQPTAACAQQYTVQAGDSLSLIAQRFYNDLQSYNVIFEATNTAADGNETFTSIDDPNIIEVGQTLCIPAQAGQQQANMQQGQQDQGQQAGQQANMQQDESLTVPQGMSKVIFENLSSRDLIVDVSEGPTPQSVWVEPGTRQQFVVEPGDYVIMGHQPGGEFAVPSNRIELTAGELVGLVCDDAADCQMQQGVQEILALRQQGQDMMQQQNQPGTMQQQNQQGTQQQNQPGTMQPGQQDQPDTMEEDQPGTTQPGQQNDDQGENGQQSSG